MIDAVKFRDGLKKQGKTIAGWCRINGYSRASVQTLLAGKWGTRAGKKNQGAVTKSIHAQMKKDGLQ